MKLLLGTANQGKIMEMSAVLADVPVEIITPLEIGITDSPTEEGETFEENAREKARFYHARSGLPTLADDSGILIEALANKLGIHTRRWGAGKSATDEEWITYFLERMKQESNKRARFECCLCFIDEHGVEHMFEGRCDGHITDTLESAYLPGLPISSCFKPEGYDVVYSALRMEEKNKISHRGQAMGNLREYVRNAHDSGHKKKD